MLRNILDMQKESYQQPAFTELGDVVSIPELQDKALQAHKNLIGQKVETSSNAFNLQQLNRTGNQDMHYCLSLLFIIEVTGGVVDLDIQCNAMQYGVE